jgi:hypothetical protein
MPFLPDIKAKPSSRSTAVVSVSRQTTAPFNCLNAMYATGATVVNTCSQQLLQMKDLLQQPLLNFIQRSETRKAHGLINDMLLYPEKDGKVNPVGNARELLA